MPDAGAGSVRNRRDRRRMLRRVYRHHLVSDGGWIDLDRIESEMLALLDRDPNQAERFFLDRPGGGSDSAYDVARWRSLARPGYVPDDGAVVTVGVDGARWDDALAVVATEVETGHQWPVAIMEAPPNPPDDYEHDLDEADSRMVELFRRYTVRRVYCDPQRIEKLVDRWQGRWGKTVVEWHTNRDRPICHAVRNHVEAVRAGDLSHDGDPTFEAHIRNARKDYRTVMDDNRRRMWTLSKDAPGSPRKIDAAMAAVLSWEARGDVIAAGEDTAPVSVYESRGIVSL